MQKWKTRVAALSTLVLALGKAQAAAPSCPRLAPKDLPALAAAHGGQLELVFFASWCTACKPHLTARHNGHTVLVGSFDKAERLEQVIHVLKPDAPCYLDNGITTALGVASLPKVVVWPPPGNPR